MSDQLHASKAGFNWLLKMAWRDGRASSSRLFLFMASIILGIAALVSIQSFSDTLQNNIVLQSKALMGADFIIDSNQLPNERVQTIIDSLQPKGKEVTFVSMASFPGKNATKLSQIRGIEGGFPIYGELETEPVTAALEFQERSGALVDATIMLQFGLKVGDSVKIGQLTFPIAGRLISAPGSTALSSSVAPAIIIPFRQVAETELLQIGSRQEYNYYFKASPDLDLELLDRELDPVLDAEGADLDTHTSTSGRLGRRYSNVGKFLNLVAFIALLLGCVGIASSVNIYIKEKLRAVAVLKCLGASRKQSFLIYLLQIAGMGVLGGAIGTILGLLLQLLFPTILAEFLPFDVTIEIGFKPVVMGLMLGLCLSVLFALLPLMTTWFVSPLEVLRVQEKPVKKSRKSKLLVFTAILLFVFLFAFWLLGSWRMAISFVLVILITFGILSGIASLFMWAVKKYFPHSWGFTTRQSLLNLFRPNNQTMTLMLAIGVGSFLISTLYFTKDILLSRAKLENSIESPNLLLLDVQTAQREEVINTLKPMGLPLIDNIPIVTMRIHSIKGRAVNEIREDTTSTINQWILNHEFRVTYRDALIASETLTAGEFVPEMPEQDLVPISLADNVALDAQVVVGDTLVFNVQGVLMETVISSIRNVDWGRMQLNFSMVFPKGVLENAPQFHVLSTKTTDEIASAEVQRALVRAFPNISIIDLRQILALIEGILDKISWVINFMAFFSILTGIIVLIGAVRTSKYQRIKESVLLRTIGAKNAQILKITALEYFYLGILGCLFGILLSLASAYLLAEFVFETTFSPSLVPFLVLLPGITLLVLFIGVANSRSVLNSPPLQVLRKEVR